ncbi:ring-cleaving dioxygenase [Opitutales bacterium ASA1]|uniref:ring-cleaving dioxygenase n=1 Tax=Congregicoccus parvus TaxID=3081749 RepID=UPI002B2EE813|nr:ring-cleaving dioxygenase [Opitutales bacterium ASA1]
MRDITTASASSGTRSLRGIHHVTAIASDPQRNVDFYAGVLGLRLIKKTVNFDDPSAYHLYYGDESGTAGSIVTFFYWPQGAATGRVGAGQMTALSFSAPNASLPFWKARLESTGVTASMIERYGERVLAFADPDGIPIEIVAVDEDARAGWIGGDVPAAHVLRGLHTARLTLARSGPTRTLATLVMGYRVVREETGFTRLETGAGGSGTYIDLIEDPKAPRGLGGVGTIHHVAWSTPDDATELKMQELLAEAGVGVSPVRDRNYFHSIYYREPGGVLFEIATEGPGFAVDESLEDLGSALKIPAQYEPARAQIERILPPLRAPRPYGGAA